jgi:hypothetical protein
MMMRALDAWLLILLVAFVNGAIRELLIVPRTGDTMGHVISTVMLCAAILLVCWLLIGWIRPAISGDVWRIGAMWLGLTLTFEFLAGHYLLGTPWRVLLADYDILRGRIWAFVLVTTALAPWLMAHGRGLLRRPDVRRES